MILSACRGRYLPALGFLFILVAVVLVYGGTLHAPWYFDDHNAIVENPEIRQLGEAWHSALESSRGLTTLTFALNYHFGGLEVSGYHLVNISIHLVTCLLVYALLRRLLPQRPLLALGGALAFAVHPLQTQAVTYVVQRMTCLGGLFFFLSVLLFVQARQMRAAGARFGAPGHLLPYTGALLAGLLAVSVKQNAATLPLVLLLVQWLMPSLADQERNYRRLLYVLPFFAAPAWLALQQVLLPLIAGTNLMAIGNVQMLGGSRQPEPLNYLFTEFSVLWLYLRLFFLPVGQALDYSYPVVTELWTPHNLLALGGLVVVAVAAWSARKKYPLVTLGVFWFFTTLMVESTIIPLDPAFEHRMYVPIFGLVLILLDLFGRIPWPPMRFGLAAVILLGLAFTAWKRNELWNDPIAFYESNLKLAPQSERVMQALAKRYTEVGRVDQAEALLRRAIELNPSYAFAYDNLATILVKRGDYQQALGLLNQGLTNAGMSQRLLSSLGYLLDLMGKPKDAEQVLRRAIAADPRDVKGYVNLGAVMAGQRRWEEAIVYYEKALKLMPERAVARYNLGVAFYNLGRLSEAKEQFRWAMDLNPRDPAALFNYGMVALETGDSASAATVLPRLRQLNPLRAQELEAQLAAAAQAVR